MQCLIKTSSFNKSLDRYQRYFDHLPLIQNTEAQWVIFVELQEGVYVFNNANVRSLGKKYSRELGTTWSVEKRNRHQHLSSLWKHNSTYFMSVILSSWTLRSRMFTSRSSVISSYLHLTEKVPDLWRQNNQEKKKA